MQYLIEYTRFAILNRYRHRVSNGQMVTRGAVNDQEGWHGNGIASRASQHRSGTCDRHLRWRFLAYLRQAKRYPHHIQWAAISLERSLHLWQGALCRALSAG